MSEETWAAAHHERLPSVVFFLGSIDPVTDGSSTRPHQSTTGIVDQTSSKPTFGR
jgi:hypothetical protein